MVNQNSYEDGDYVWKPDESVDNVDNSLVAPDVLKPAARRLGVC
jgi:hypothetical protein